MFTFLKITVWLCCLVLASAANINDISFSNLEITPLTANKQPDQGWTASFDFTIADASSIREGDEFTLSMPHVYRIKLSDSSQSSTISLRDGTEAFKCYVSQQAAYLYENTTFTCTAQTDLSSYNTIDGSITFSLNFSNGNSKYKYELENAKFFKSGPMLVQLGDQMSDIVNFGSAAFTENVLHSGRTTGYGSFESYHLGMRCPNGYFLGGIEKIDYDNSNHNVNLDCSSVQVYSSNDFNDWWFPQSYNNTNADITCFGSNLWITLDEKLDDGEMVWVNALQSLPANINTIDHALEFQYTCFDTIANTTYASQFSTTREFIVYQGQNLGTASAKSTFTSSTISGLTSTHTSAHSIESTSTIETGAQTTSEVFSHVETTSAEPPLTAVPIVTSTSEWTDDMKTHTPQSTSSASTMINSTSLTSSSAVLETSDVSFVKMHTDTITNTSPVSSEEPTFVTSVRNFLNSFSSRPSSNSPNYMSIPHVSSVPASKSLLTSSFVPTTAPILNTSIKTESTEYFEYSALTISTVASNSLSETVLSSQDTKSDTSLASSLMAYYSSTSSSQPFSNQQNSTSTSIIISIYEGKASMFFSSELGSIFFLVLSYLLF